MHVSVSLLWIIYTERLDETSFDWTVQALNKLDFNTRLRYNQTNQSDQVYICFAPCGTSYEIFTPNLC